MAVGQPGSIGNIVKPRPEQAIARELRDLKRRVAKLETTRPIYITTLTDASVLTGAVPTTSTAVYGSVVTIPSGYTSVAIMLSSSLSATRSGGLTGTLLVQNVIGGTSFPTESISFAASTQPAFVCSQSTVTLSGLSGGSTILINVNGFSGGGTWDSSSLTARVHALICFLR